MDKIKSLWTWLMNRKVYTALGAALILTAVFFIWRGQVTQRAAAAAKYETIALARGSLIASIGGTGTVHASQSATMNWQTSGTVEKVNVKLGQVVKAGDELAVLKRASLPQSVIMAQADLTDAKKALEDLYKNAETAKATALQSISKYANDVRDAQYQLDNFSVPTSQTGLGTMDAFDQMKKKLDKARADFEPYKYKSYEDSTRQDLKDLLDEAQSDYDAAVKRVEYEYNLEVAQTNLKQARQDYEKYKDGPTTEDLAAAQARVDAAQATVELAHVTAPFSGTVTAVEPKPGDEVNAGTLAFRIDDLSSLIVDVQVSEIDINQVQLDQDVTITFDAILNKDYHGKVREVALVGTDTEGVVDFVVQAELADADAAVKPGMTAAANIVVNQLQGVLVVPNRAVRQVDGSRVIYILRNGKPEAVKISLGASSDTNSEVVKGDVKIGDLVVLNPPAVNDTNGPPPFVQR